MSSEHSSLRISPQALNRVRLTAALLVLQTLAFTAAPGRILPDTKLDMTLNPVGFLSRAFHMWDPSVSLGQVQNQAYGYFFPMGPFYLLGDFLSLPPWIIQRLWLGLVLCTAFLGVVKLAEALRMGSSGTRFLAGFAYALAPRAQVLLGINSSEFWPTAVLPWVLLPLVTVRSPRRAAALSALAVAVCGGINATAVLAVLIVPLLYLLWYRRRLLRWWLPLTAAASFWWLAPTYLMGRYIFEFLPYTETAATTTSVTSTTNVLRGASQWTAHLPTGFSPWWPAGNTLATNAWLITATLLVAGLGMLGLRRSPYRPFLAVSLLLGLVIIVTGHPGTLFADYFRDLLDGPLAAFRNLHKFDALLRLPLALGLACLPRGIPFAAAPLPERLQRPQRVLLRLGPGRVLAVVLVGVTAVPTVAPGLGIPNAPKGIPGYMREATAWLNEKLGQRDGAVLALPGQPFGQYLYGQMMDDPLQSMLKGRWVNRMVTPGGSVGLARLMEAIDERFATGRGSPGLATVLSRMGVKYLLIRNDTDRGVLGGAWPARLHDTLAAMPEVRRAAGFGSPVGLEFTDATGSFDQKYRPVEIYEVPDATPVVSQVDRQPLRVGGGPEALIALADQGLLDAGRPVSFDDGDPEVVTDTLRKREVSFSDLRGVSSPTMEVDQKYLGNAKVKDFTDPDWEVHRSVAELSGIKAVVASSSSADITSVPDARSLSRHPFAALDGDARTHWASSGWNGANGEWLKVEFTEPNKLGTLKVSFGVSDLLGPAVSEVEVATSAGRLVQRVRKTTKAQMLRVPVGPTDWLRIKVTRTAAGTDTAVGTRVAISELAIPGIAPRRSIAVPGKAPAQVFTGLNGYSPACMRGSKAWVCSPYLAAEGEEGRAFHRVFTSPGGSVRLSGTAILTDVKRISAYTGAKGVSASSRLVDHPASLPRSAFDGDHSTTWTSSLDEESPSLTRDLGGVRTFNKLSFRFPSKRGTTRVILTGDRGQTREGLISKKGVFTFAPMRTRTLTIAFPFTKAVQVSEVAIPGVPALSNEDPVPSDCGTGPSFTLGSTEIKTRLVNATSAEILAGHALRYQACKPVFSSPGRQFLSADSSSYLIATTAFLPSIQGASPTSSTSGSTRTPTEIIRWEASERLVNVQPGEAAYLVVAENFNEGWTAVLNGQRLKSLRLDGWKQAWKLPAGVSGIVRLSYEPNRTYQASLVAGLISTVLIMLLALLPGRGPMFQRASPPRRCPQWIIPFLWLWVSGPFGLAAGVFSLPLARKLPDSAFPFLATLAACSTTLGGLLHTRGITDTPVLLTEWIPTGSCLLMMTLLLTPPPEPLDRPLHEEASGPPLPTPS